MRFKFVHNQDTPLRQFPKMTFCFTTESVLCGHCLQPILNDSIINICSDLKPNKIWHENDFNINHDKIKWVNRIGFGGATQKQHSDFMCILKIVPEEIYNELSEDEIIIL